jgi:hypothetical protein
MPGLKPRLLKKSACSPHVLAKTREKNISG